MNSKSLHHAFEEAIRAYPPPIYQFFPFDGRALVSRFGCSLRVY